jgi:hypothetical protein
LLLLLLPLLMLPPTQSTQQLLQLGSTWEEELASAAHEAPTQMHLTMHQPALPAVPALPQPMKAAMHLRAAKLQKQAFM